jgi:hypothetical protein
MDYAKRFWLNHCCAVDLDSQQKVFYARRENGAQHSVETAPNLGEQE